MLVIPWQSSFRDLAGQLTGFDPDSELVEALKVEASHLLVTARAGSGKTAFIALQTALSVLHGLEPDQCLSLCFNRKAASELSERFGRYGIPYAPASTFHALAYAIVRPKKGVLMDTFSQHALIRKLLPPAWFDPDKEEMEGLVKDLLCFISRAKRQGMTSEGLAVKIENDYAPFVRLCVRIYGEYERHLKTHGLMDFDDLMERAIRKLSMVPHLPVVYLRGTLCDLSSLRLLCVDEFQDFTDQFFRLTRAIMERNSKIRLCAVGDDWQAINGFAGSNLKYFRDFPSFFPDAKQVMLRSNHRSGRRIVEHANKGMRGKGAPGVATKAGGSIERIPILDLLQGDTVPSILHEERHRSVLLLARRNDPLGTKLTTWEKSLSHYHSHIRASTIHAAKGTEADTILVIRESNGNYGNRLLPALEVLGYDKEQSEEEEGRVEYVALTRARERLIIAT